jgi:ABC-type Fe3+-hydroxamate transport system substrate-binding protein
MTRRPVLTLSLLCACTAMLGSACGDSPAAPAPAQSASAEPVIDPGDGGQYAPIIEAANFVDTVDNPYFPLRPGSRWVYDGTADGESEHNEVVVTGESKTILGIPATVVRDTVSIGGEIVEDTYDWYAQDREGNVWYLGEASNDIEKGKVVSTAGSWEAGVDGAYPGIVMQAAPQVGDVYRQEFYPGEAEDLAEVLEVGPDRLLTREWNPLDPEPIEEKTYERGVGLVAEEKVRGGDDAMTLTSFTPS